MLKASGKRRSFMAKIGVIGAGSWGTALAVLLANNGHEVTMWSKLQTEIDMLKNDRQLASLEGVILPDSVAVEADLQKAMDNKELLVLAVASAYIRSTANLMKEFIKDGQVIVNVAKGVEEDTLYTMSEVISDELPTADVAVLSGPSHAEEVGKGIPTTIVVGATTRETAELVQSYFMSKVFRVYISPDIKGIELGAALKNVIALAAGIADGLGYGDNTKAALITRGIAEISRLGTKMGCKAETFAGLSGIGDLIVTCASMHSRNRRAGILLGKGFPLDEVIKEVKMVVEGVYSAKAALKLAKEYDVEMPIIEQVNAILFEGKAPADAVSDLMLRDKRNENADQPWE